MLCSPILQPDSGILPGRMREWLGTRLGGPPGGRVRQREQACFYLLGRIGDFVMALSVLRMMLREFGEANCTLVISPTVVPLAEREFPGAQRIELPTEAASLVREIFPTWWRHRSKFAGRHYRQRINLRHQRTLYHEVTFSWIDAEKDVKLVPETYPHAPSDWLSTELLAHGRVAETVLQRPVSGEEILPRFTTLSASDDGRLLVYPLSRDTVRCLSPHLVAEALRQWRKRSRAPIVFGGSPSDAIALESYLAAARQVKLDGVTMELPAGIDGFLEHIARAGAVLTTETAAAHVATALDKPTTVLLGGGFHGLCYPWRRSSRQIHVQYALPCFGCGWHCTQTEMFCLTQLSPSAAASALPAL